MNYCPNCIGCGNQCPHCNGSCQKNHEFIFRRNYCVKCGQVVYEIDQRSWTICDDCDELFTDSDDEDAA